jgi:hypothetical protein
MSLELSFFAPRQHDRDPNSVIVAPYGYRGNPVNGADLRQHVADATDTLVIGLQPPGTNRIIIDRPTKRGLTPDAFPHFAADQANDLLPLLHSFEHRGIWADSGAGIWGAEMWTQVPQLFNWGLFRDAANLHAPHTLFAGAVRHKRFSRHPRLHPADQLDAPPRFPYGPLTKELIGAADMWHQRHLFTGTASRDAFVRLAGVPDAGFTYVQPSDALSGTRGMHENFFGEMRRVRERAVARYAGHRALIYSHLEDDMSHGDLLAPNLLLDHLELAAHNATTQQ